MNIDEINIRIEKVMKTDATFAREADFMLTHVPFKKLYDFVPESGQTLFEGGKAHYYINPDDYAGRVSFTEEELLERFSSHPESHKFLLVQGNSGTGKSNLIRWIYYMYKKALIANGNDAEQIIFIQRSYNSLKDAVKRILDYNILPDDRTRFYLDKIGGGGQEATGEELAATAYAMLEIAVNYDADYDQYIDEDVFKGIKILMGDSNIKKYIFMKKDGAIDRICRRISGNRIGTEAAENVEDNSNVSVIFSEKDFELSPKELMSILNADGHKPTSEVLNSYNMVFNNPVIRRETIAYLNSLNEKVIARSSTLDATDVQGIFKEIRKELRTNNKNLTLFIEDINAYTGMDKALIEILIDDEEDDDAKKEMCRLKSMVGSTDNFYDLLHTSLKARITDSVVVLDESVLSDDSKLLEFAARYINAVNVTDKQVDEWYYENKKMPIAEIQNRVASIELDGETFSIFPFTKEAIVNLFSCLDANYRTPRGLLKYVVKHTLTNWNTMEDRIFEVSTSFINIGIRSFSALMLPEEIRRSIISMSDKEKQYIQIWGYDYRNNTIVNNSENERNLFRINVAENVEQVPSKKASEPTITVTRPSKEKSKKDKALNHIEEWEKNINPNFAIQKDMRDWIGKYILGQINWQLEGVLFSKADAVCKGLSFIEIEGHEGQGRAEFIIERNSENADFFRALVYWNYEGEKKSWNFPGGMEEKIIAKAWLLKNKSAIIDAVKRFGKLDQVAEEYVVRAKVYSAIAKGALSSLDKQEVIEVLTHKIQNEKLPIANKSDEWKNLSSLISKYDETIDTLFKEYFFRAIGSSDVNKSPYIFVDKVYVEQMLMPVIDAINSGKDKPVTMFGNKKLEAPIEVINIFQQDKDKATASTERIISEAFPVYKSTFGENAGQSEIKNGVYKMQQYLEFVNHKTAVPPYIIRHLEDTDTPNRLVNMMALMQKIESEKHIGYRIVEISNIDDKIIQTTCSEIKEFLKFLNEVDKKYASNINVNVEKDISARKKDIKNMVKILLLAGGEQG